MEKTISIKKINLKACASTDLRFVYNLMKSNMEGYVMKYWGTWDQVKFKASLNKDNIEIVYYNNKKIGFFDITRENAKSYLHNIQITPAFQGRGIGTAIMLFIEKKEKLAESKKIKAKVFKDNPSLLLYNRLGYKIIKKDGHALIISKNL